MDSAIAWQGIAEGCAAQDVQERGLRSSTHHAAPFGEIAQRLRIDLMLVVEFDQQRVSTSELAGMELFARTVLDSRIV
jgi:hypothetical protein